MRHERSHIRLPKITVKYKQETHDHDTRKCFTTTHLFVTCANSMNGSNDEEELTNHQVVGHSFAFCVDYSAFGKYSAKGNTDHLRL